MAESQDSWPYGAARQAKSAITVVEARTTMAELATYIADVKKYSGSTNEAAVAGIVKYLGIALRNADSALVSGTDPAEMKRVRDNFLKKKLALTDADDKLDAAVSGVVAKMKADKTKSRVTVYYLLAEQYGKLDLFIKA